MTESFRWNDFAFNKTGPRFVILFGVEYFGRVTDWVFLVALDCWIQRTEIDVMPHSFSFKLYRSLVALVLPP